MFYTITCGSGFGDFYNRFISLHKIMIFFKQEKNLVINKYSYVNYHSINKNRNIFKTLNKNFGIYFIEDLENKIKFPLTIEFSKLLEKIYNNDNILNENINLNIKLDICEIKNLNNKLQNYYILNYEEILLDFLPAKPTENNIYYNNLEGINVLFHFRRSDLIEVKNNSIIIYKNLSTFIDFINILEKLYKNNNFNILIVTNYTHKNKDKILKWKPEIFDFQSYENNIINKNNKYNIKDIYYTEEEFYNIFYYSDMILSTSSCLIKALNSLFKKEKNIIISKNHSIKEGTYLFL